MRRQHLASGPDDGRCQAAREIGFERQHAFGLRAVALEHHRQRLFDRAQCLVDDLLADAALDRFGP